MKNKIVICAFLACVVCMAFPVYADKNGQANDPLDESVIINSLEMESDSSPVQEGEYINSGEIIFDNSFNESEPKTSGTKISGKKKNAIISRLRSDDKRWHLVEYKVKANDTVWSIAKRFGTDCDTIIEINDIKKEGLIKKNQVIFVPSKDGVYYTIKKGDTLTAISRKYNSDISEIASLNNINGTDIRAGRRIFIPGAIEARTESIKSTTPRKSDNIQIAESKPKKVKNTRQKNPTGIVLSWPLRGPVTSGFGYRSDPFSGSKRFHCGMDIGADIGSPVKAAGNGKVLFSGWKGSYGYLVVIAHEKNYISVYAHNSKILVNTGEEIKKGQVVALSGNTGATTGAHVHFEIRKGTVPLNPRRLLKK